MFSVIMITVVCIGGKALALFVVQSVIECLLVSMPLKVVLSCNLSFIAIMHLNALLSFFALAGYSSAVFYCTCGITYMTLVNHLKAFIFVLILSSIM